MSEVQRLQIEMNLRPTRVGLLVDPLDSESLSRWMRLTSILWGGALNPIIPVCEQVPAQWRNGAGTDDGLAMAMAYLRFFEPDVLVEAKPGLASRLLAPNPSGRAWGHVFGLDDFVRGDGTAAGLLADHAYTARYRREAQFVLRDPVASVYPEVDDQGIAEIAWGVFPNDKSLAYVERTYREAFKPENVKATVATWLKHYGDGRVSPLAATFEGLDVFPEGPARASLFVFDPASTLDRIDLWNSRLFRAGVLPVPVDWVPVLSAFMRKAAREGRPSYPGEFYTAPYSMTVEFGEAIPRQRANELVADHLTDANGPPLLLFDYPRPSRRLENDEAAPRLHRISGGARSVKLELDARGSDQVAPVAPSFETLGAVGDFLWANVVTFGGHLSFDNRIATVFPTNEADRGFPRLDGIWGQTVVNRDGVVVFPHSANSELFLQLPDQRTAISDWLSRRGVTAKPSGAGRIAEEMLRSLGGPWGAALVSEKPVLDLLDKMAVSESTHINTDGGVVQRRFDGKTAGLQEWRGLIQKLKKSGIEYNFEISDFVERKVLRLGLTASCKFCGQSNWFPLDGLDYELPCERCLRIFAVPGTITQPEAWRYRVIGSFSVPNFADGAYAVALTLRFLTLLMNHNVEATSSTAMELSWDGRIVESDFLMWWRARRDRSAAPRARFILGEAKSFATRAIDAKIIENLVALSERFPDAVMVVSKLGNAYSEEEKVLLRDFRAQCTAAGRDNLLIVLTGFELLARATPSQRWASGSDKQKTFAPNLLDGSLEALAEATCAVYLEPSEG